MTYGVLCSVRHQARKTNDLINAITARFGTEIIWHKRTRCHEIKLAKGVIFFKTRGNIYADYLELACKDIEVLNQIKAAFPDDFKADVQVVEGIL